MLRVTGADVRDWLERSASAFQRIIPGKRGQMLLDPGFSSYNFDVLFGLSYSIDVSQPARYSADGEQCFPGPGRIRNLRFNGRDVDDADRFLVVTNSYRAAGGGHHPAAARGEIVLQSPLAVRKLLADHIGEASPICPRSQPTWRFAPLGGTRVLYETGPGAADHTANAAALSLSPHGPGSNGFFRFELTL